MQMAVSRGSLKYQWVNPHAPRGQFCHYKMMQKITKTLALGYSSESSQPELSNEYQHARVKMIFKYLCILVPWTKLASALVG